MTANKKQIIILSVAGLLGAATGFVYWYYVGCNSGSCAITSSPVNSSIYGAVMSILLVNVFQKETAKTQ